MNRSTSRSISGWGRYPTQVCYLMRPEKYTDLLPVTPQSIARGQGRSYGDASLNENQTVILTERLNRFLAFDKNKGILTAEAGVTLSEILDVIVPAGFFLPVTPGTQYASLGGCVATDVHGKNHHREGSLGNYVIALELITADQKTLLCSPNKNSEIFWATIGGMGLTGIIGTVVLKLKPITSDKMVVKHHTAQDLEQTFHYLSDASYDDEYSVAWIDCLSRGKSLGRGIVMTAHHASEQELPPPSRPKNMKQQKIGLDFPGWILNNTTIRLFNQYYFKTQAKKTRPFVCDYQRYFYPLDNIIDWNRMYGKRGFVQYQCVVAENNAFNGIRRLLETITKHRCPSFLAVLKRFGASNNGLLSFPIPGYTLALDIPFRNKKTLQLLEALNDIVIANHGRVYLAKDACLSPEHFRDMYDKYPEWLKIKQMVDPQNVFSSSLARRLKLGTE